MHSSKTTRLVFGAILPHTRLFGGVKRFLEIGNVLHSRGHTMIIFAAEVVPIKWFDFKGTVEHISMLDNYQLDMLFISEEEFLPRLKASHAKIKAFYALIERSYVKTISNMKDLVVLVNSLNLYHYVNGRSKPNVIHAPGGIDVEQFKFKTKPQAESDAFCVLVYGRFYRKKKGTMLVVRACERLYASGLNIKLLLFDSPTDEHGREQLKKFKCKVPYEFFIDHPREQLAEIYYKADVFVSAERNAGWSNTTAEAMACGVPVIATRSGTKDFLIHLETGIQIWRHSWFIQRAIKNIYHEPMLRKQLAQNARKKIEGFSWENLTEKILSVHELILKKGKSL